MNGYRDGDIPLDVTDRTTAYFGGQPLQIRSSGASLAVGDLKYCGVALNSRFEDAKNGKVTILRGFKGMLENGSDQVETVVDTVTVEGLPYDNNVSYVEGDLLYIKTSGLWTNATNAGSPASPKAKAIVTRAPSGNDDSMEAYFFDAE
jgi:hypothetical protein